MGQIMLNGTSYAGALSGACGCFVDATNVIQAQTSYSTATGLDYTATQDCAVFFSATMNYDAVARFLVDGVQLCAFTSSSRFTYQNTIFLRRGQTITSNHSENPTAGHYTVYGLFAGLDSYEQVHYEGGEKAVGTWIDGSTIYEWTTHFRNISIAQDGSFTLDSSFVGNNIISYTGYNVSNTTIYALPDGRLRLMIENGALKLKSINGGTWSGDIYISLRFTKPTT